MSKTDVQKFVLDLYTDRSNAHYSESVIIDNITMHIIYIRNDSRINNTLIILFDSDRRIKKEQIKISSTPLYPSFKVNADFYKAYQNVVKIIYNELDRTDTVIFSGFGFGAGVATIAALLTRYDKKHLKHVGCITFSSPRVGDKKFGQLFKRMIKDSYRVVLIGDRLIRSPGRGYKHVYGKVKYHLNKLFSIDMDRVYWNNKSSYFYDMYYAVFPRECTVSDYRLAFDMIE